MSHLVPNRKTESKYFVDYLSERSFILILKNVHLGHMIRYIKKLAKISKTFIRVYVPLKVFIAKSKSDGVLNHIDKPGESVELDIV